MFECVYSKSKFEAKPGISFSNQLKATSYHF